MGVSDNMRTFTLCGSSHSEGRAGRMPVENGDCSFHAGQPKYKRRQVFALRDFPPGCGRVAQPTNLRPTHIEDAKYTIESNQEKPGSSSCPKDGEELKNDESVGMQLQEASLEGLKAAGLTEHVEAVEQETPLSKAGKKLESPKDAGLTENVKAVEQETPMSKGLHQMDVAASKEVVVRPSSSKSMSPSNFPIYVPKCNDLKNAVARKYPPRRSVSAVREFPPDCGPNAPRVPKEETCQVPASVDDKSLDQGISHIDDKLENAAVKNDLNPQVLALLHIKSLNKDISVVAEKSLNATLENDTEQVGVINQEENAQETEFREKVSKLTVENLEADSVVPPTKDAEKRVKDEMGDEGANEKCPTPNAGSSRSERSLDAAKGSMKKRCGQEIVVYNGDVDTKKELPDTHVHSQQLQNEPFDGSEPSPDRVILLGLMASSNCPWRNGKTGCKSSGTSERKGKKKQNIEQLQRVKDHDSKNLKKKKSAVTGNFARKGSDQLVIWDEDDQLLENDESDDFHVTQRTSGLDVSVPPFGPSTLSLKAPEGDSTVTRIKVRETLRLFQAVCRKLLQEVEGRTKDQGASSSKRVDLQAAKILRDKEKYVNTGKQIFGPVPGVEVGDEFHYRIELNIIGLHRQIQAGIDYVNLGGQLLASSVVASGGYANDLENSDVLIYTGQGGNVMNADKKQKQPEDQKLEKGNLALKTSIDEKNPVRVIRGSESPEGKMYVYDGLYLVEKCWQDMGPQGKLVYKFQLNRIPGQPELALKEVKKSKNLKLRKGLCVEDISTGKEVMPIPAVNTIDDEKPPQFKYITRMMYPDWCRPLPLKGCDCINGCSDSEKCFCAVRNGGEIPFNHNGSIVEAKPLVYECSRQCKCSSTCHNRVSQKGIKFQLEIFKTKDRGWGVRSLSSIPSGSFICEYLGELLEEREADKRTGNDEYLFDIGNNYNDNSLWEGLSTLIPELQSNSWEHVGDCGFTIDAVEFGNVGRFINHSCSPNLYAQNVLYDHEDSRIPHIMFFAAENIPPLQELTYHYNYVIDQVRDSDGNIKKKSCYCGSVECTGRLY